jgi:putative addiction module component (TIGR02574 family)
MDITLPLSQMTVDEKLRAIEVIWEDLARSPKDIPSPAWHAEVLAARQKQIDEGKAKFISLDEFRDRLEKDIQ